MNLFAPERPRLQNGSVCYVGTQWPIFSLDIVPFSHEECEVTTMFCARWIHQRVAMHRVMPLLRQWYDDPEWVIEHFFIVESAKDRVQGEKSPSGPGNSLNVEDLLK